MAITTRVHGGLPDGIRDHDGVLDEKPDASPQGQLLAARSQVKRLEHQHSETQVLLRRAVEDEAGDYDFVALKANVHRLARELEAAEEQVANWTSVVAQVEKADRGKRFDAALVEARASRREFAEHFCGACLALGRWYKLGGEIRGLVSELADKMPTGHVYYTPELKKTLAELDENPNPLHQLLDSGYSETQNFQSWKRHCAIVPLAKTGEEK